jgi:hypothetical protein
MLIVEPGSYATAMKDALTLLEGDNELGRRVRGEDFWLIGSAGAIDRWMFKRPFHISRSLLPAMIKENDKSLFAD